MCENEREEFLRSVKKEDLFNELIKRGVLTVDEAQLSLMTGILPDCLDTEGEEWKDCLK